MDGNLYEEFNLMLFLVSTIPFADVVFEFLLEL